MIRRTVYYATQSRFKKAELEVIANDTFDSGGTSYRIGDLVDFRVSPTPTEEPLEIDLEEMVRHKARSAYKRILAPCIVEHAGLILEKNADAGFPGGLTQPMWDHLKPQGFLDRIGCGGERATARAVVGFCDGKQTYTFIGETMGTLAKAPSGGRDFYWYVIFRPDDNTSGKTYAEIAGEEDGLRQKLKLSQSTKAIRKFAEFLLTHNGELFDLS